MIRNRDRKFESRKLTLEQRIARLERAIKNEAKAGRRIETVDGEPGVELARGTVKTLLRKFRDQLDDPGVIEEQIEDGYLSYSDKVIVARLDNTNEVVLLTENDFGYEDEL